ncbi:hypothetical protein J7T55_004390 [Diaporthe amygdali]|uniref:uncharacterized protein n=1 Tax=Phomopsis amygdali TaxID=1214568 RepID=UPI0022FE7FEC|nr:uncharacterized protein J7T55_004390 [Diaporthe amygdali]KAJ0109840.1 hypothetical protein J7T55_004390 [Diaporthe amygdali]
MTGIMAPAKSTRAKKFAAFEEKAVKDYDPEANAPSENESDSEADEDLAGTEHYVNVGKSQLRQKEAPSLGPEYRGVRVSRAALEDSSDGMSEGDSEEDDEEGDSEDSQEYDDPETADLEQDNIIDDEEIDSDEAFEDGEEELFRKKGFSFKDSKKAATNGTKPATNGRSKRAVAADFMSGSGSEDSEAEEDGVEDDQSESDSEDDEQTDDLDSGDDLIDREAEESSDEEGSDEGTEDESSEDEDDEDEDVEMGGTGPKDSRSTMRELMQKGQKSAVATISQAAKADAEKGVAVRKQRRTYDSLLNLRIRLQKGLVATNSLNEATEVDDADKEPYEAAEEAAIKLWNAIDGFRASLLPEPKAGDKRKREVDITTSSDDLWEEMQATEQRAVAKRNKVLDKWSTRVKNTTATMNTRQLGAAKGSQSLVSVLEDQMLNSDRLIKRTQVPRSCAPVQGAKKVTEDPRIYDDADFYQLLLKELVDQRTSDSGATGTSGVPTVRWTAIKEAKTRKQVDRRASKGRKLRFTVHEKLQNFMAPEDRRSWEGEAIDRLFSTLFGQRTQLKEDDSDEEEDDLMAEEEGLELFRS